MNIEFIQNRLGEIVKEKKIPMSSIAKKCNFSVPGFYRTIKGGNFRIDLLLKIAEIIEVPVSYFFQDENTRMDMKMNIEISISQVEDKLNIEARYLNFGDINILDTLCILDSLKKTTENNLSYYMIKNKIKFTEKTAEKVLSKIKLSELEK